MRSTTRPPDLYDSCSFAGPQCYLRRHSPTYTSLEVSLIQFDGRNHKIQRNASELKEGTLKGSCHYWWVTTKFAGG